MKKLITACIIASTMVLMAQDKLYICSNDAITSAVNVDDVTEITFPDEATMTVSTATAANTFSVASVDSMTVADGDDVIEITYDGTSATVVNPQAFNGVTIAKTGADVVVTSTCSNEVEYRLSGTATDGSFKIYSDKKYILTLNGVSLTNNDGPAINSQSGKKMTLNLADGTTNYLTDSKSYTTVDGEDMKATLFSEGKIDINGTGTLNVTGLKKHAIAGDDEIVVNSGNIIVSSAASDAIHSNDLFDMKGGTLNLSATGDGIDGDDGDVAIEGGTITISTTQNTTKGIKCSGKMDFKGGNTTINTSGGVVVTNGDPSYCTAIKCDSTITIDAGTITIVSTGEAGKGISSDLDIIVNGGDINVSTSGNGAKYTNTSNAADSYSATCIKADRDIKIMGGTIVTTSSGTAGKGISADGELIVGDGTSNPSINVSTTGAKFLVSGSGNNADYANPKAIKSVGNLTVNSGTIVATTTKDGGEGLESKDTLTINGGTVEATTYDDAINAANAIVINGGLVYCYASGNDGMDSNGTITITGGVVIASGTTAPEEGFDCDQNTFKITGGILIGTGGATSTPTSSVCTQKVVVYSGTSATANQWIDIRRADGTDILTYKIPRTYNSMTLLFSSPELTNATYTIYKTGSVTGGTDFHGYVTGGTYTPGTSATTFTASQTVTTIGNSGGGGGGGFRP